jgi:dipeptidyl aminopeptidase/acylaminoacyl peptidase
MKTKICFWILVVALKFQACNNRIEPAKILSQEIPVPTSETMFYVTNRPLPGLQIASRYQNGTTFYLSTGPFDVGHSLSRDKQWIVFARGLFVNGQAQPLQIWKMHFNGNEKTPLTPLGIDCQQPKFSADGRQIAFTAQTDPTRDDRHVVTIKSDGTDWQQKTNHLTLPGFEHLYFLRLSWFPDNSKLVVDVGAESAKGVQALLGVLDLATGAFSTITQVSYLQPWQPDLSSVDDRIVFVSGAQGGGTNIFTVKVDGTGLQQLTYDGKSWQPDWSADNQKIAFARENPDTQIEEIWTMDADGSNPQILIRIPETTVSRPRW